MTHVVGYYRKHKMSEIVSGIMGDDVKNHDHTFTADRPTPGMVRSTVNSSFLTQTSSLKAP